jgi:ribulose-5-phosphate 4-epimerase/fuculose-1-phosphate aldolase
MNTPPTQTGPDLSTAEWAARVDLAAAYRAAAHFGWNDTIYNHFTCRVPGQPECFLVKRHGHTFDEVTASSLVKIDLNGRALSFDDDVNPAAFAIHTAILSTRPDVNVTLHLHTPAGIALSTRPEGFRFLNQEAAFFFDRISYYHFGGMILRNHGVAVAAATVQGAFTRMQYLLLCAQAQLLACSAATPPLEIDPLVCAFTRDQFEAQERHNALLPDWKALRRRVDRHLPGYAD